MNNLLIFSRFPLAIVLFIVFAFIVFYIMTRDRYVIWKISAGLFAFSITAGFSIYTYGYLMNSTGLANVPSAALRGIFSAVRMFFINDDFGHLISETGAEWLTDTIWLYILYWLSHVSALIVIQATLLSLFGRRLIDYCRLRFGSYHEAYIIKGGNKDAIMLGESIATHDNKRKYQDTKRLVIILPEQSNEARELYKETAHFGGIVQTPDSNHDLIYFLSKTGLGKKTRQRKKYYVILMSGNPNIAYDIQTVSDFANEKQVNHECIDIYVLTLTDWDMEEVERITQSKSDISSNHRYPYTLHIVSETDLLIRQMIQNAPPYKSPNFRFLKTGEAAGDYTVMILGFGTLGQRALLRLITNGQFYGSKMKAIVVDKDIKRLNYCFTHRYPGLELCCEIITSDDYVVPCEKFYELLSANDNVNYIVVTFDDYSENHQIAIDIRNYYERKNISNPPFITVYDRTSGLRNVKHDNAIFTFGCHAEIYTESVILRESIDIMAKAVNSIYEEIYSGKPWQELDWITQESNRSTADYIPIMLFLAGLSEDEVIDRDILTEDNDLAEILARTEQLRWLAFHAATGFSPLSIADMRRRFETFKGDGSALDYCRKDVKARLHVCLTTWDNLEDINKAYRELATIDGNKKEQERDFKKNDRDIVKYIPKYVQASKSNEKSV